MIRFAWLLLVCVLTVRAQLKDAERMNGFLPLHWDEKQGKIWLEIPRFGDEFLYVQSLPAGIGSNDIGLDRGQIRRARVVRFERNGPKVLLVQSNLDYRANSNDPEERKAVRDSFAESILWGFKVESEMGRGVVVDATDFFVRDAYDVTGSLQNTRQGTWRMEGSRSALYKPRTKSFPRNTEVETIITLTGGPAGAWLRSVTPSPDAVTVRQHHSFIALPEAGYQPREFDPRSGFNSIDYMDYAVPVTERITKRFIPRHRLEKKDPSAAISEAVKPIVYYLDRGTPEPIRSALLEGALWWNEAFEAAGFRNAFRVELMPEGADPMDVRYNMIQWVHRSTRGWSYGASVTDPRTGETLKGHVTLGSLRVRQDYLIAEGFLAPYEEGKPLNPAMLEMALARLRQLSAHEVGHTLGLEHNYIASTKDRASVMDYPHPFIGLGADGVPEFSKAYAVGMGEWDKVAIRYGYAQESPVALRKILDEARARGLVHLTDQDARPAGGAHPEVHLWDSGANAVDELQRMMKVRRAALQRFSEKNIKPGEPMAMLEDVLVPVYLSHRYQVEAAVKTIGGVKYSYALRGDGQKPIEYVPAAEQMRALNALLDALSPAELTIPTSLVKQIPPRPSGFGSTRELFRGRTGLTFDTLAPAEAAANLVAGLLLHPERASRLVELQAHDAAQPGLRTILDRIVAGVIKPTQQAGYAGEVQRTVASVMLTHLMALASSPEASASAKAQAFAVLRYLRNGLAPGRTFETYLARQIEQFEKDPKSVSLPKPQEVPPGMPIGSDGLCTGVIE